MVFSMIRISRRRDIKLTKKFSHRGWIKLVKENIRGKVDYFLKFLKAFLASSMNCLTVSREYL
jgi:hypothetical protein